MGRFGDKKLNKLCEALAFVWGGAPIFCLGASTVQPVVDISWSLHDVEFWACETRKLWQQNQHGLLSCEFFLFVFRPKTQRPRSCVRNYYELFSPLQCVVEGLCWLELAAQSGLPCCLNGSDVCSADLSLSCLSSHNCGTPRSHSVFHSTIRATSDTVFFRPACSSVCVCARTSRGSRQW